MKRQVPPMIIVENKIHRIINLLVISNINSIVMIEQQKIPYRTDYGRGAWKNMAIFIVE